MNYDKKRNRQKGRQAKTERPYKIWIDEYSKIHASIEKDIKKGRLPEINFDLSGIHVSWAN